MCVSVWFCFPVDINELVSFSFQFSSSSASLARKCECVYPSLPEGYACVTQSSHAASKRASEYATEGFFLFLRYFFLHLFRTPVSGCTQFDGRCTRLVVEGRRTSNHGKMAFAVSRRYSSGSSLLCALSLAELKGFVLSALLDALFLLLSFSESDKKYGAQIHCHTYTHPTLSKTRMNLAHLLLRFFPG